MKRFLAFTYDSFYPCGGKSDFAGDFHTIADAEKLPAYHEYLDVLDTQDGTWWEYMSGAHEDTRAWRLCYPPELRV